MDQRTFKPSMGNSAARIARAPRARLTLSVLAAGVLVALGTEQIYPAVRLGAPYTLLIAGAGVGVGLLAFLTGLRGAGAARLARRGLAAATLAIGLELWVLSFTLDYELLGGHATAIGTALFGLGVLPLAIFASATKGYFVSLIALAAMSSLFALSMLAWIRIPAAQRSL